MAHLQPGYNVTAKAMVSKDEAQMRLQVKVTSIVSWPWMLRSQELPAPRVNLLAGPEVHLAICVELEAVLSQQEWRAEVVE